MVDYLVEISSKSYGLMKEEFFSIFEAIDQKLEEPTTEIETQEDSDDEGEDLMESDGEEESESGELEISNL